MAEITIRLIYNKTTGKKDIFVDFESDADALPIEHEQGHRQIVEQLIGKGLLSESEAGVVQVSRSESSSGSQSSTPISTPRAQGESS